MNHWPRAMGTIKSILKESGETQVSTSDPDSRQMIVRNNITVVAYNTENFRYIPEGDYYICPQNQHLTTNGKWHKAEAYYFKRYATQAFRLPDGYYNFLNDKRHNDEKLLASQEYRNFLHELYMHLYRDFHQSELNSQYDTLYKAGYKSEAYRLNLRYIIENSNGFEQEYFVSKFFSKLILWKSLDGYEALYDPSLIGRDDYNQILVKEYTKLQKLIAKPVFAKDLNLHDSGIPEKDLVFPALPQRFPGKVIYVDFWAPWCGPCMAEMPQSKKLQEKLKGKDVVFVFLANKCSEESWKATIAQKQLTGEHFLLADKEYDLLADKFDIAGIPRYMVIDMEGMVIKDNAPRPSDESLVGLLTAMSSK